RRIFNRSICIVNDGSFVGQVKDPVPVSQAAKVGNEPGDVDVGYFYGPAFAGVIQGLSLVKYRGTVALAVVADKVRKSVAGYGDRRRARISIRRCWNVGYGVGPVAGSIRVRADYHLVTGLIGIANIF